MFATFVLLRHLNIRLYFFVQRETHLMRLQAKLNELKQNFLSSGRVSPEMIAIMTRGTDQLRNSGILQRVLKPGDKAPSFELPNQDGKAVSSAALLAKGPLVLSFFRGVW
jgi:AhpC/TSA family